MAGPTEPGLRRGLLGRGRDRRHGNRPALALQQDRPLPQSGDAGQYDLHIRRTIPVHIRLQDTGGKAQLPRRRPKEPAPLSFGSRIGNAFKWNTNPLSISSVFMGTSDGGPRPIQRPAFQQLQGLVEQSMEFELISLIGGMYFLELAADFPFRKVRLFDSNLAEHTKWSFIYKYFMKTPFARFEQFRDLDKYFEDHPDVVYLPQLGRGGHSLSFSNDAHFDFNNMRTRSVLLLYRICYIDFAYNTTRTESPSASSTVP